ncbi:hypothetical protein OAO08_03225 [Candidatus Pelagibacter sp.]|nr:hypothetical protein [Candidatus Pelagibacter sp.]
MKKNFIIIFLSCLISTSTCAQVIYCYAANDGNRMIKARIPTDLINSKSIEYFEINNKKKKIKPLKSYWEYRKKSEFYSIDNNMYNFVYFSEKYLKDWDDNSKTIRFNESEIIASYDFISHGDKPRRYIYELDRIAGILLIANYGVNSSGDEITEDDDGQILTKKDKDFRDYISDKKYFCEISKKL